MMMSLSVVRCVALIQLVWLGLASGSSCTCSAPVATSTTITHTHMEAVNTVVRVYVRWPIKTVPFPIHNYFMVYTTAWYKNDIGFGQLVVKALSHKSCAGGTLVQAQNYVLFGTIQDEVVPDYAGKIPVLTLDGCRPQKLTKAVAMAEWNTLHRYSPSPSAVPTQSPTTKPSVEPTTSPSVSPTMSPTKSPTRSPTVSPTTAQPTLAPVTNKPTPTPDPYRFQLDMASRIPEGDKTFFRVAVNRWQSVIAKGLPDFLNTTRLGPPPRGCTYPKDIDDLYLCASYDLVKSDGVGGVVGFSLPVYWRTPSYIPFAGAISLDSADISTLKSKGLLGRVVLHELGHVLGIGTQWKRTGVAGDVAEGCPYFGPKGNAEYSALTGCAKVPTELNGGTGTQCQHWDETCLGDELMTGFVGGRTQLSRLTIAGLEDLGYDVNYANSDYLGPDDIHPSCMCKTTDRRELYQPKHGEVRRLNHPSEPVTQRRQLSIEMYDLAMERGDEILQMFDLQASKADLNATDFEFAGNSIISMIVSDGGSLYGVIVERNRTDD